MAIVVNISLISVLHLAIPDLRDDVNRRDPRLCFQGEGRAYDEARDVLVNQTLWNSSSGGFKL